MVSVLLGRVGRVEKGIGCVYRSGTSQGHFTLSGLAPPEPHMFKNALFSNIGLLTACNLHIFAYVGTFNCVCYMFVENIMHSFGWTTRLSNMLPSTNIV